MKIGQVFKNRGGQFGKIIHADAGLIQIAGWFMKEKKAKEAKKANFALNSFGLSRATGLERSECKVDGETLSVLEAAEKQTEEILNPDENEVLDNGVVIETGDIEETEEVEEVEADKLKVDELKTILDDNGVKYDAKANKADLVALVKGLGEVEA